MAPFLSPPARVGRHHGPRIFSRSSSRVSAAAQIFSPEQATAAMELGALKKAQGIMAAWGSEGMG
eukprot:756141-Hanusia_phi.AAC.8